MRVPYLVTIFDASSNLCVTQMFRLFSNRRAKLMRRKKTAKIIAVVPTQVVGVLKTVAQPTYT